MYSTRTGLVLGFHGCDKSVALDILNHRANFKTSQNSYDWLGHGTYFWENSPDRAFEFAKFLCENPRPNKKNIEEPAVLGVVIDLGQCFDLLDYGMLKILKTGYDVFKTIFENSGRELPENIKAGCSEDLLLRNLDCAVFETIHANRLDKGEYFFDTVRGVFWEGGELYPNAGFREKDHIQICVRNPNCIKGVFLPRELDSKFQKV